MLNFKKYDDNINIFLNDEEKRKEYDATRKVIRQTFWVDAFNDIGIPLDHPKAKAMIDYAWSEGHANGYSEVYYILRNIWEKLVK
jgi:hypothetical protein